MTIQRMTVLDQIECTGAGVVQIRFNKLLLENGVVLASQYHRCSLAPGENVDAVIAVVNAHLEQMGAAKVEDSEWGRVRKVVAAYHTPELIAAYESAAKQRAAV